MIPSQMLAILIKSIINLKLLYSILFNKTYSTTSNKTFIFLKSLAKSLPQHYLNPKKNQAPFYLSSDNYEVRSMDGSTSPTT